jgi:hypothetical protein
MLRHAAAATTSATWSPAANTCCYCALWRDLFESDGQRPPEAVPGKAPAGSQG